MDVTILLTPQDAELFKKFQQYHHIFALLESESAFDIGWGKVVLNFADGELQNCIKEEVVWKRLGPLIR